SDVTTSTSLTGATFTIPGAAAANTYSGTITYIDANGCSGTDAFTVTINANPVATVNDPSVCVGDTSATLTVTATTGSPTQYTIDYNAAAEAAGFSDVTTSTSLTGATFTIPGAAATNTYGGTITYIDANGCSGTDAFTVTINANPVATVNDPSVCVGDTSATLTLTATTGSPTQYTIDYDAAAEAAGFSDVTTSTSLTGATFTIPGAAAANTYGGTITYIDANGCSGTDAFTVTINANPVATVNDPSVCVGDTSATLTLTATTGSPTQYTIDYNAAAEAAGFSDVTTSTSLTGATFTIPGAAAANTYSGTITYIDANGCSGTDAFTVTINANPVATVNDPSVCVGDTSATLTVTATTGSPTQYTIDYNAAAEAAGFSDVTTNTSLTGATFTIPGAAATNTYGGTITYIDANGCSGTDAFTVTINANPVATVNDVVVVSGTTSANLVLTATSGTPTQYTIDYDAVAEAEGFSDVITPTNLTSATYVIPASATAGIYNGIITYIDSNGCSATDPFTITIDELPIATNDVGNYTSGSSSSPLNVTTNDTTGDTVDPSTVIFTLTGLPAGSSVSPDGKTLTVSGEGTWGVDNSGNVIFTPNGSFTGDPTPVSYTVEDAEGNVSNEATVTLDTNPIASDDNGDYTPGNPSDPIDVAGNDTSGDTVDPTTVSLDTTGLPAGSSCTSTDTDGDCIEVTVPGEGVWTVNPTTGEVVFTPDGSFTGDPTPITYDIEDAQGNSDSATITVVSDPLPIASDDNGDYTPGSPSDPIDVAGNDTSGDTVDPTTVSLNTRGLPAGSSCTSTDTDGDCIEVTVPGEGIWTVNPTTGEVVFTPDGSFTGDPTPITYDIEDAQGNSDSGTITVVADPLPIASDDNGDYTPGNSSDPIDVAGNDTTGDTVDPTTVSLNTTGLPAGSSCTNTDTDGDCIEVTVPGEGVWTVNPTTGEVVFTPEGSFTGDPTPITYNIEDAQGNSDSGTITVVADPLPIASDDNGDYTPGNPSDPIDVAGNDTTGDTVDPTTVSLDTTGLPSGSSCTSTDTDGDCIEVTVPGEGVWTVNPTTGEVVFTPDGSFTGDPTPITYDIEDAQGNSDSATITVVSDPLPIASDDNGDYTPGNPSDPIDVAGNDTIGDTVDPSTVSLDTTGLPAGSSCTNTDTDGDCIEVTVPGEGVWTVNSTTGEVVFTPDGSFTGDPTPITYDIEDAQGNSDSGTITVVADPLPIASDDNGDYTPGNPSDPIDVAGNDTIGDTVDPSTVSLDTAGLPAGSSCISTDTDGDCIEVTVPGEGVWTVNPTTGEVVFTPDGSFTGDPTPITYDIEDAQGNSDSATITVVSDPLPIASDDNGDYTPGNPSDPIDVAGNDTTGDTVDPSSVSLDITGLPAGSSCTNTDTDGDCIEVTVPGEGVWTVNPMTGEVVFTPDGSFTGDPTPITYDIEDAQGNSDSGTITVVADPLPIASDDNGDYTPGNPSDPIDVAGNDTTGDTVDPSTVSLDTAGLPAGSSCTNTDMDGDCIEVTVPGEGIWTVNPTTGEVVFTPDGSFTGDPTPITYNIEDAQGNSDSGTITVVADPLPIASDDNGDYTPGNPSDPIDVAGNDTTGDTVDPSTVSLDTTGLPAGSSCTNTDTDGDCIEVTVPGEGVWTVNPMTGEVVFTPDGSFTGDPTPITYDIEDAQGNSDSGTITVVADPLPIVSDDNGDYTPGNPSDPIDVVGNDTSGDTVDPSTVGLDTTGLPAGSSCTNTDTDGDCIEVTVPGEGVWTVNPTTGEVVFTPDGSFTGDPAPITYDIEDAQGNSDSGTITVVADPLPIATNDVGVYTPGSASSPLNVTTNDTTGDTVDPSTVIFTLTGLPAGSSVSPDGKTLTVSGEGVWTVDNSGNVIFTPDGSFTGTPTVVSYTVEDAQGNVSNEATITLSSDPLPIASDDNGDYTPGSPSDPIDVAGNDTIGDTVDPSTVSLDTAGLPAGSSCTNTDTDGDCIEVTVPGEGIWTVNPTTGEVVFTPEGSFTGDPTPITYD
ncbi:hypothetical protein, partial [uncultured Tenacibaculum sp.]|uniref:Ig-like domain-containing protein n=1 Tax=uncultured Tenacibaculum sp. TaxID=174713 RepID=UPI0026178553